jgi:hypothetical protein
MTQAIRLFMFFEGAAFISAALTYFGVLIPGYEYQKAGTAESVVGIVLLIGLALNWIRPRSTRGVLTNRDSGRDGSRFRRPVTRGSESMP